MHRRVTPLAIVLLFAFAAPPCFAQDLITGSDPPDEAMESPYTILPTWDPLPAGDYFRDGENDEWFPPGGWGVQLLAGYYPTSGGGSDGATVDALLGGVRPRGRRVHFDYVPICVRLGYTFSRVRAEESWRRGTFELLLEYLAAPVTREFGSYVTGPSLLLRYNYQQPGWWIVPYTQAGAGVVFTDGYRDETQRLIGGSTEFLLQMQAGVHVFVTDACSIDLEGGWQHISNADTQRRNAGANNVGGSVGLTYRFGRGW